MDKFVCSYEILLEVSVNTPYNVQGVVIKSNIRYYNSFLVLNVQEVKSICIYSEYNSWTFGTLIICSDLGIDFLDIQCI